MADAGFMYRFRKAGLKRPGPGQSLKIGLLKYLVSLSAVLLLISCDIGESEKPLDEDGFKQVLKEFHFDIAEKAVRIPDFEVQLVNGQKELLSLSEGKVVLLNFWATWCFPCKQEMPDLEELAHKMKGEKFRILAVNSGDKIPRINRFLHKYPYSFDIVVDEKRTLTNLMKVEGLPTTYILNHNLEIIGKVMGVIDWKSDEFVKNLKSYSRI